MSSSVAVALVLLCSGLPVLIIVLCVLWLERRTGKQEWPKVKPTSKPGEYAIGDRLIHLVQTTVEVVTLDASSGRLPAAFWSRRLHSEIALYSVGLEGVGEDGASFDLNGLTILRSEVSLPVPCQLASTMPITMHDDLHVRGAKRAVLVLLVKTPIGV